MVDTYGTGKIPEPKITELVRAELPADAARHHRRAEPAPADLHEDGGVRPLRPHRAGVHLGAHRQGRGAQEGRRPLTGRLEAVPHRRRRSCVAAVAALPGVTSPAETHVLAGRPSPDGTIAGRHSHPFHAVRRPRHASTKSPQAAARAGLKFIVITDHGDATRAPDPPAYRHGVLCLDAVEISTAGGHYIALDMPAAPYPLGGEARDVVEDVKRLGGFGIVAHPDSPKTELRWREWIGAVRRHRDRQSRYQLAAATRRRPDASRGRQLDLVARLFSYPFRPAESIASLDSAIDESVDSGQALAAAAGTVVTHGRRGRARAGSHGGVGRSGEPRRLGADPELRVVVSSAVRPRRGRAGADGRGRRRRRGSSSRAIRAGHLYSAVDGAASPPAFEFTATNALGTAHAGDRTLRPAARSTLHVRSNAPPGFTTTVWNGADDSLSGDHHEQDFSVRFETPGAGGGVYWVEIRATGQVADASLDHSNPIYVRALTLGAGSPAAAAARRRRITAARRAGRRPAGASSTTRRRSAPSTSWQYRPDARRQPGCGCDSGCERAGRRPVRRARRRSAARRWRGAIAWRSRSAPSSPCGCPSSSARAAAGGSDPSTSTRSIGTAPSSSTT